LLQLSPAFSPRKHELSELEPLIEGLADYPLALEFRNRNWVVGDLLSTTIDFLRKRKVGVVNVDALASDHFSVVPSELNEITNPNFSYLRLHGRDAKAYLTRKTVASRFSYDYSDNEIADVCDRSRKLARETKDVHVVFNNNNLDYAPRAAARLRRALGQSVALPSSQTPELFEVRLALVPESPSVGERSAGPRLPDFLAQKKRWLADHHMTLVTMADTPHSIALGSAIGIFFRFTPLWSLKTLLCIGLASICRCNK